MDKLVISALAHPVLLLVGPTATTQIKAHKLFQSLFCAQQGCGTCRTCLQLEQRQHHAVSWFAPQRNYLVEDITSILEQLTFSLEAEQHRFLVLTRADSLTSATANRLLKSLEEPPRGYHFLLLAERLQGLLPTIRSRSVIHQCHDNTPQVSPYAPYVTLFAQLSTPHLGTFLQLLEEQPLTEQDTARALDEILEVWMSVQKQEIAQGHSSPTTDHTVELLIGLTQQPPMPGSAKLFWKNLYLQMISQT